MEVRKQNDELIERIVGASGCHRRQAAVYFRRLIIIPPPATKRFRDV